MEFYKEKIVPKVSIIIPHFKGKRLIKECLASLQQLNYPQEQLEIKVIDNCSPDGSLRGLEKEFPRVSILKNNENNYCKANNIGIAHSEGHYVGFLNNDTVADKNWLAGLVKVMEYDKKIGCAGGKILLPDGRIQSAGHVEFPDHYWGDRGFREPDLGQYNIPEEMESISGSALLFRRECLQDVGKFDEDFVMYLEDIDIFFRARKQGWKICYVPESIVYHKFHGTSDEKQVRFYIERNRLLLIAKHFPNELGQALEGGRHSLSQDELFRVLPEMFLKLFKEHKEKVEDKQIRTFFASLHHLYNFAKDKSVQELTYLVQEAKEKWEKAQADKEAVVLENTELENTALKLGDVLTRSQESLQNAQKTHAEQLEETKSLYEGRLKETTLKLVDELARSQENLQNAQKNHEAQLAETKNSYSALMDDSGARLESIILKLGEDLEKKYVLAEGLKKKVFGKSFLVEKLTEEKTSLEQTLLQKGNEVAEKYSEIASLHTSLMQLQNQRDSIQQELNHRLEILHELEKQRDGLLTETNSRGETIHQLEEQARQFEIKQAQSQEQFLVERVQLQSQLDSIKQELNHRLEIIHELEKQRDGLLTETNNRNEVIRQLEERIRQFEAERAQSQGQFEVERVQLQNQRDSIQQELNHRLEILHELEKQRDGLLTETNSRGETIHQLEEQARQFEIKQAQSQGQFAVERAQLLVKVNVVQGELNRQLEIHKDLQGQKGNLLNQVKSLNEDLNQQYELARKQEILASQVALERQQQKSEFEKELSCAFDKLQVLASEVEIADKIKCSLEFKINEITSVIYERENLIAQIRQEILAKEILLHEAENKRAIMASQIEALVLSVAQHESTVELQKNQIAEKDNFIKRLLNSRTYRYFVSPLWRISDFIKWSFGIKSQTVKTLLVIKPFYVSVEQTRQALMNLSKQFGSSRVTLVANVFQKDFLCLKDIVEANEKILFCPILHKLTLLRFMRLFFWMNLNYFDQAIILIGPPTYQGYRKGKLLLLFSGAKSVAAYFAETHRTAPLYSFGFSKSWILLFEYVWGVVSFVSIAAFFLVVVVLPLKMRKMFKK